MVPFLPNSNSTFVKICNPAFLNGQPVPIYRMYILSIFPGVRVFNDFMSCAMNPDEPDEIIGRSKASYYLPAAQRGQFVAIPCYTHVHRYKILNIDEGESAEWHYDWISVKTIADCLQKSWADAAGSPEGKPGICAVDPEVLKDYPPDEKGVIRGTVESAKGELATILKQLEKQQEGRFNEMIAIANGLYTQGHHTAIHDGFRDAARWLYGDGANKLPWYGRVKFENTKNCIACQSEIPAAALQCPKCQVNLLKFMAESMALGIDLSDRDQTVAALLANVNAKKKSQVPPQFLKKQAEEVAV